MLSAKLYPSQLIEEYRKTVRSSITPMTARKV